MNLLIYDVLFGIFPDKSNHKEVEEWNDLWADMAYGPSAMSSNEQAIVETLEMALRSQSWKAKAQVSVTILFQGIPTL